MIRVIIRRLLIAIPTMIVVSTFTFFLAQLVPGSPASYILGTTSTSKQIHQLNASLGLDRSLVSQYLSWLGHLAQGNLGTSYITHQSVETTITQALGPTLSLAIGSTVVALLLGLAVGTVAAVRGGRLDGVIQTISNLGMAVPSFWLAALLVLALAIKVRIFPATGYISPSTSPWQWFVGMVLPITAVAMASLAQIVLQTRSSVLDVLSKDFVRTLQAAGVPRRKILFKHVLRNAAIPVTTLAGLTFVYSLAGVVVVETIFNMPGMGTAMIQSVSNHNLPVLQGAVLYFSLIVVVVTLATDLMTAWLDPRIRLR
jgi:peptide/nickel transport system permease protein